jgi:tetratricopeptide (TPR) repeat protein
MARSRVSKTFLRLDIAKLVARLPSRLPVGEVSSACNRFARYLPDRLPLLLRNSKFGNNPEIVIEFLHRARRAVHNGPARASATADQALAVALRLKPEEFGAPLAADLRAQAWAWKANADRVSEKLDDAEASWRKAFSELEAGSGDPLVSAELWQLHAALRTDQRQFSAATAMLRSAVRAYTRLDEPGHLAVASFRLGRAYFLQGKCEDSIDYFNTALANAHRAEDPNLRILAFDGLLHALEDSNRHWLALKLLSNLQEAYLEQAPPMLHRRHQWLRGRIFLACGGAAEAIEDLDEVRREFLAESCSLDASLCALDLALAYARTRQWVLQKRLAEEMLPIFSALRIEREAIAAFLLYVDAAQSYEASASLVEQLHDRTKPLRRGAPLNEAAPAG